MSDKRWAKKAASKVMTFLSASNRAWNLERVAEIISETFAVDSRAPAPQPAEHAGELAELQWYRDNAVLVLDKSNTYQPRMMPDRGSTATEIMPAPELAATPQVTHHITRLRPDEEFPKEFAEYDPEGTSEPASPTPDKCPTCGSDDPDYSPDGDSHSACWCEDSWHSSASTPKGNK